VRDREEAIRWLVARGYRAFARDWALGESIGVSHLPPGERKDDPLAVIAGPPVLHLPGCRSWLGRLRLPVKWSGEVEGH
jgi:hypothetical protein